MKVFIKITVLFLTLVIFLNLFCFPIASSQGLADSPWPCFRGNTKRNGLSSFDTSEVYGSVTWNLTYDFYADIGSPVIGPDGTIYCRIALNKFSAVNPDGTLKWIYEGDYENKSKGFDTPAISQKGEIYIPSKNNGLLRVFNPDGTLKFDVDIGDQITSTPIISDEGTVYIGSRSGSYINSTKPVTGKLSAINQNGQIEWEFLTDSDVSSSAIDDNGNIYFGTLEGKFYSIDSGGTENWVYFTEDIFLSSPAIDDNGDVYIAGINKFYIFDSEGNLKNSFDIGDVDFSNSPAISPDGMIIFCSSTSDNGYLYSYDKTGKLNWKYETGCMIYSSPAIGSDGTIFFGTVKGGIFAFNPNGKKKWSYETGYEIYSSPAIGKDGVVYIGDYKGNLYAIGPEGRIEDDDSIPWIAAAPTLIIILVSTAIFHKVRKKKKL